MDDKVLKEIESFKLFNPAKDSMRDLPDGPGNYIILLVPGSILPTKIQGVEPENISRIEYMGITYDVIYTGISSKSLRERDYHQHFKGNNAGRSTLRKSLGSLMGLQKIPRDVNNPDNGKTKFRNDDESELSAWMCANLLLLYKPSLKAAEKEKVLINSLNPPLNIQGNNNLENRKFRDMLKKLRK